MEADFDSINAIPLTCGTPFTGTTADGSNVANQYLNTYWHETGKEKIHKITTSYPGRIRAKISNTAGKDLDVFILKFADRLTCLASDDSLATLDNAVPGTYYIVVDGRYANEGSYTLEVICPDSKADLILENGKIRPNFIVSGGNGEIVATIKNIGNTVAPTSVVKFYLSDNMTLDGLDLLLANTDVKALASKESNDLNKLITLPEGLSDGTKYIFIKIDADNEVAETDEQFNTFSFPIQIPKDGNMDCSAAVPLSDGIQYKGNSILQGKSVVDNYICYYGLTNKEVVHTFTPAFSGMADLEFSENLEGTMNLLLLAGCNENACVNSFGLYERGDTILKKGFFVSAGVTYYLVADGNNLNDVSEGSYSIKLKFPTKCPVPPVFYPGGVNKCNGDPDVYLYSNWEYNSYQWKKDGLAVAGAINSNYSTHVPGSYSVEVVENGCKGASENVVINYSPKPTPVSITNLSDTIVCDGGNVTLQLNTGSGYTCQWTVNDELLNGETSKLFKAFQIGLYRAEVTNNSCTVKSNPVHVVVNHIAFDQGEAIDILSDSLISYWPFTSWGNDESGNSNYAYVNASQAKDRNNDLSAFYFNGTENFINTNKLFANPDTFTIALWFKTDKGGKLIGFDLQRYTQPSTAYDRHIYIDNGGIVYFGVEDDAKYTIKSLKNYNDNQWHHIAASLSPQGLKLYMDAKLVASNPTPIKGKHRRRLRGTPPRRRRGGGGREPRPLGSAWHDAFRGHAGAFERAAEGARAAAARGLVVALSLTATREFTTADNLARYARLGGISERGSSAF